MGQVGTCGQVVARTSYPSGHHSLYYVAGGQAISRLKKTMCERRKWILYNKDSKDKKPICEVLRLLRISNDLSIKELSEKSGISASYIAEIESGNRESPSVDIIDKYSKALNVSKSTIMFFEEDLSNKKYDYKGMLIRILRKISAS